MAHTDHASMTGGQTEGDGVSYRGIVWFVAILAATTLVCQVLMWALFGFLESQTAKDAVARAPVAAPVVMPHIDGNLVKPGSAEMPPPYLQANEPLGLDHFRKSEAEILEQYGWVDKSAGVVRLPIDRAKELLLERGIPGGHPIGAAPAAPAAKTADVGGKPVGKIIKD